MTRSCFRGILSDRKYFDRNIIRDGIEGESE